MNPSMTQKQMISNLLVSHPVGTITLAPSELQPSEAEGDSRMLLVSFSDETLPVSISITDLKMFANAYGTRSTQLTAQATKATENQTTVNGYVDMTAGL